MRKIRVDEVLAYSVGFDASLLILDTIYDTEDKVKLAYVVDQYIIGNVTTQKVRYTNKGAYIKYFGRRIYLNEFFPVDFYGMEFVGGRR